MSALFVNIILPNSDISEKKKGALRNVIISKLQSQIGIPTIVFLNLTQAEVKERIGDISNYYYVTLTANGLNNVMIRDSVNNLPSEDFNEDIIENIIVTTVRKGLRNIEGSTENKKVSTTESPESSDSKVKTVNTAGTINLILVRILFQSSDTRAQTQNSITRFIKRKLERETGVETEVLVNVTKTDG